MVAMGTGATVSAAAAAAEGFLRDPHDPARRAADHHLVAAGRDPPAVGVHVPVREVARVDPERHALALPRPQRQLAEALQLPRRLLDVLARGRQAEVELRHLDPGAPADVLHRERDRRARPGRGGAASRPVAERRVRQAEAERDTPA